MTAPEGPSGVPEDPASGHAEQVEPLPASDASAIWVDPADPLAAPGPLGVETGPGPGAPLIKAELGAAAFFDLDNTVMQGASMFHLARGFYRRGFFPTRVILQGVWLQAYFRIAGRENPQHIQAARSTTLGFIEGHTVAEVEEIATEVYEESIAARI